MIQRVLAFLSLIVFSPAALAGDPELTASISLDIPPYVMENATKGLEVDIVRFALAEHSLRFVQMPYAELETAVQRGRADISVTVRQSEDDGAEDVFYSDAFITFELATDGSVVGAQMKAASPSVDFSYDFHDLNLRRVP